MTVRNFTKSNVLNAAYAVAILFLLPRLAYHYFFHHKYRGTLRIRIFGLTAYRTEPAPCVWFKADSLGEVRLLEPLVRRFQRKHPYWHCIVSAGTTSGYVLAKQLLPDIYVFPHPIDFTWSVRAAMDRLRPDLMVHVDLGVCPNLVREAKARGTGLAIINGRMNDRDYQSFHRARWFMATTLKQFDLIAAQTDEYADRFVQLGASPHQTRIVGSMKYDCVNTDRDNALTMELATLAEIGPEDSVLMAGSTHRGEEEVILTAYLRLKERFPRLRLILAPRHVERVATVMNLLDQRQIAWQRRSHLEIKGHDPNAQVILVDTIGETAAWWGTCQIAFVGGSLFGLRGKNMLEPAATGAAVCFGPDTKDFRHIAEPMVQHNAATIVSGPGDLFQFANRCLTEPCYAQQMGKNAQQMVLSRTGSIDSTMRLLDPVISQLLYNKTRKPQKEYTPWKHSRETQPLSRIIP